MNIRIRKASVADMEAVHNLVRQLAEFEREPEAVVTGPDIFRHDGFSENRFKVIVAEDLDLVGENHIIGMALYFDAYSTWKGKFTWLDDLIVQEEYRRYGIGKNLFNEVMKETLAAGHLLLKWQVLDWNEPAIRFYEKMNTLFQKEWLTCRLTREEMQKLIS